MLNSGMLYSTRLGTLFGFFESLWCNLYLRYSMDDIYDKKRVVEILQNEPAIAYYFQKKLTPFLSSARERILTGRQSTFKLLDIQNFLDTFCTISIAYGVTAEQRDCYNGLTKDLSMALYYSHENEQSWSTARRGELPAVYDVAVSDMTTKKILRSVNKLNEQVEAARMGKSWLRPDIQKDLLDYADLITKIYYDSLLVAEIDTTGKVCSTAECPVTLSSNESTPLVASMQKI